MTHDARGLPSRTPLAVLGAGAWGLVLATLAARDGRPVRLWTRRRSDAKRLARERGDARRHAHLTLPDSVHPTADLAEAVDGAAAALVVVPNAGLDELLAALRSVPAPPAAFVAGSKGLLSPGLRRPSEAIAAAFPDRPVAVLSGPNLASEIAVGLPAATTVASRDAALAARVQAWLGGERFRVYTDDDPAGVEVAGAYKNVIALAAGMSDALTLGDNAKAALVARGLAETVRLGRRLGGRERTFYGLAGVGDLVATCATGASRNHAAGYRLALGETAARLRAEGLTVEGFGTAAAVVREAGRLGLSLPIAHEVHAVVEGRRSAAEAVAALLGRDPRGEWEA